MEKVMRQFKEHYLYLKKFQKALKYTVIISDYTVVSVQNYYILLYMGGSQDRK